MTPIIHGQDSSVPTPAQEWDREAQVFPKTGAMFVLLCLYPVEIQVLQMYPLELLRQLLSLFVPVRKRTEMFIFLRPFPGPALHCRPSARGKSLITIRMHLPPSPGLCSSNGHTNTCQHLGHLQRCSLNLQGHSRQEGSNFCNLKASMWLSGGICLCFCIVLWAQSG